MDISELKKEFETYKKQMKTDNLLKSTHNAKEISMQLFEDQGIASIALVFSQVFADLIANPQKVYKKIS